MRRNNINVEKWIYEDSRREDVKAGRENDLTLEYIAKSIQHGCLYCGENAIRMTLDRIDNQIGHTVVNTVPACIRCNYMRRNMPYRAWLVICPAVRLARELGAFEDWQGRPPRSSKLVV